MILVLLVWMWFLYILSWKITWKLIIFLNSLAKLKFMISLSACKKKRKRTLESWEKKRLIFHFRILLRSYDYRWTSLLWWNYQRIWYLRLGNNVINTEGQNFIGCIAFINSSFVSYAIMCRNVSVDGKVTKWSKDNKWVEEGGLPKMYVRRTLLLRIPQEIFIIQKAESLCQAHLE